MTQLKKRFCLRFLVAAGIIITMLMLIDAGLRTYNPSPDENQDYSSTVKRLWQRFWEGPQLPLVGHCPGTRGEFVGEIFVGDLDDLRPLTAWPMFGGTPRRNLVNTADKNMPTTWVVEEGKQKNIKW